MRICGMPFINIPGLEQMTCDSSLDLIFLIRGTQLIVQKPNTSGGIEMEIERKSASLTRELSTKDSLQSSNRHVLSTPLCQFSAKTPVQSPAVTSVLSNFLHKTVCALCIPSSPAENRQQSLKRHTSDAKSTMGRHLC